MEGADWLGRWKNLKQRLRFKVIGCCGSSWSYSASNLSVLEETDQEEEEELIIGVRPIQTNNRRSSAHRNQIPAASGMNLAAALAAERNSRAVGPATFASTAVPLKTLMRLIEESDGVDLMKNGDKEEGGDSMCCVCMERSKGAAFIPCGHTFCRVCSRELWLNRRCCPICNRPILEILDIF